jgi:glutaredoxin
LYFTAEELVEVCQNRLRSQQKKPVIKILILCPEDFLNGYQKGIKLLGRVDGEGEILVTKYRVHNFLKLIASVTLIFLSCLTAPAYSNNEQRANKNSASVTENKQGPRKNSDIQAVMYMTDWCPYCKKAGKYIRSLGVYLTEFNIDKDQNRKDEMKSLSGGSGMVPLIDIEGVIIRGYVPEEIKAAVEKKKKQD